MKEIKFEDIREGDRLRITQTYEKDGMEYERHGTGVAANLADRAWYTRTGGHIVAQEVWGKTRTITLLERPLPTEPGTVFRGTEIRGVKCDVKVMVSSARTGEDKIYFSSRLVDGADLHIGKHITAWEPIENGGK